MIFAFAKIQSRIAINSTILLNLRKISKNTLETHPYIIKDIKPFDINSSLKEVKSAFRNLTHSHLPVFQNNQYMGCISETDVSCFDSEKKLSDYSYAVEPFFVYKDTNWLDIIEAFANNNSNIMPVLSNEKEYLGYFELADIMNLFNNTPFLNENGGIIIVEKGSKEYSFSEISQIIESNDSKILGIFISKIEDNITQTTIKVSHENLNSIVQSFRRYGYEIISMHQEDKLMDSLKERSDYLDKYLNI